MAVAGAGSADRIGPVFGAPGRFAHALCEPVAACGQLFPHLAGAARGSVRARVVRGHGGASLEPVWQRQGAGHGLGGPVGDRSGHPGHGAGALSGAGGAHHGQLHSGAGIAPVPGGPGGLRAGHGLAGAAQPVGRAPAGAALRRKRRAAFRTQCGRCGHCGGAAVLCLVLGCAAHHTEARRTTKFCSGVGAMRCNSPGRCSCSWPGCGWPAPAARA